MTLSNKMNYYCLTVNNLSNNNKYFNLKYRYNNNNNNKLLEDLYRQILFLHSYTLIIEINFKKRLLIQLFSFD